MRELFTCAAAGLLASAVLAPTFAAGGAETKKVLSTKLQDMPGKEVNIVVHEVEPGWQTDRHIHPGHVFVYVVDGAIEVDVEGKEPQRIETGEAFHELPDKPMIGRNASSTEGARIVVFQVGPAGEPMRVAAPE